MIRETLTPDELQRAPGWKFKWWCSSSFVELPTVDEVHDLTMQVWAQHLETEEVFSVMPQDVQHHRDNVSSLKATSDAERQAARLGLTYWEFEAMLTGGVFSDEE